MIKVKDIETDIISNELIEFLNCLKGKQKDKENTGVIFYSKIPLYMALKNKVFFKNLLTHPVILGEKKFYENKEQIESLEELKNQLEKVLEFEVSVRKEIFLNVSEFKKVIHVFEKLKKKLEKKNS